MAVVLVPKGRIPLSVNAQPLAGVEKVQVNTQTPKTFRAGPGFTDYTSGRPQTSITLTFAVFAQQQEFDQAVAGKKPLEASDHLGVKQQIWIVDDEKRSEEILRDSQARHLRQGMGRKLMGGFRVEQTNIEAEGPLTDPTGNYQRDAAGNPTGAIHGVPSFREGKIERLLEWLAQRGLNLSDFRESWFYSDSLNDLPLLQRVSHPVAVDPDPTLKSHAESHGWPVISLRD